MKTYHKNDLKASIRPRLLARGDDAIRRRCNRGQTTLQFGHACLRVETWRGGACLSGTAGASIRPRLLARGDTSNCLLFNGKTFGFNSATPACAWRLGRFGRALGASRRLQFGHACLRVETVPFPERGGPSRRLQFGHACLRVETITGVGVGIAIPLLQFGHACLRVETPAG